MKFDRGNQLLLLLLIIMLSACAAQTKCQKFQLTKNSGKSVDIMKSLKCAVLQSGWTITYSDNDSLSAAKPIGLDHVPCTINIKLENNSGKTSMAIFTITNPRGVIGDGDYYTRDVVNALQSCGAKGLKITTEQ